MTADNITNENGTPNGTILESEFVKKADEITLLHDTLEYVLSTYDFIKDSNPILKSSLERSEGAAHWMGQKTSQAVVAVKLNEPLKKLDHAAASGLDRMERTRMEIKSSIDGKKQMLAENIKGATDNVVMVKEELRETAEAVLDFLEHKLEPFLAERQKDAAEYPLEPKLGHFVGRILDLTFRFNAGLIHLGIDNTKAAGQAAVDPAQWASFLRKMFHPSAIAARLEIMRREIQTSDDKKKYLSEEELTILDKAFVGLTRFAFVALEEARKVPGSALRITSGSITHARDLAGQIIQVRSVHGLAEIAFHETRMVLEGILEFLQPVSKNMALKNAVAWLEEHEKSPKKDE